MNASEGMRAKDKSLHELVKAGKITKKIALSCAICLKTLKKRFKAERL